MECFFKLPQLCLSLKILLAEGWVYGISCTTIDSEQPRLCMQQEQRLYKLSSDLKLKNDVGMRNLEKI